MTGNGKIKCYLGEGEFTGDALDTFGGVAVCNVPELNKLMHYIAGNGFEHHVALVQAEVSRCAGGGTGKPTWDGMYTATA